MNLVITGSSSGIGKFLADTLAAQGHAICRLARSPQEDFSVRCDVSDWKEVEAAAKTVAARWQSVDGLICCSGIQGPIGPAMQADPEEWQKTVAVNLNGVYFTLRAFHPLLQKTSRRAKIITLSGGGATAPRPNFSPYAAAKAGLVRLVETVAEEWRQQPVDINAIAPGAVFTRMTEEVIASGAAAGKMDLERAQKQQRDNSAVLEKVLGLVNYLLSEQSDGISGKLIAAPWDPWPRLHEHRQQLAESDIYSLRRILPEDRGTKWD